MTRDARLRWLTGLIIGGCAAALRLTHVLSTGQAIAIGVVAEALEWTLGLFAAREGIGNYRRVREAGLDPLDAVEVALGTQMSRRVAHVLMALVRFYLPFYQWLFRRRRRDVTSQSYGYIAPVRRKMWLAIGLSLTAVIVAQTALFAATSGWLPWLVLFADRAILVALLALRAGWLLRPHLLTDDALVLRRGALRRVTVSRSDVQQVAVEHSDAPHRGGWREVAPGEFTLPVSGRTNISIDLRPGAMVRMLDQQVPASRIRFHADEPQRIAAELVGVVPQQPVYPDSESGFEAQTAGRRSAQGIASSRSYDS